MALKEESIASGIQTSNGDQQSDEAWVIKSIVDNANTPTSSNPRIPRVPAMIRETREYEKYYVPKVVSIGPYHSGNPNLQLVELLKPAFTMKLLSENSDTLKSLYKILGEPDMVQTLRNFYEEKSIGGLSDKAFTKMMILDGCFILYYIKFIYSGKVETCQLNSHQIVFVHQDLFLLENQIPFQVLTEVMKLINIEWREKFEWHEKIKPFIYEHFLTSVRQKRGWFCSGTSHIPNTKRFGEELEDYFNFRVDHLLQFLHHTLLPRELVSSSNSKSPHLDHTMETKDLYRCTFRNVNELIDVGIRFKPSNATHLTQISFVERWWWFSADLELPPITVDDSTKPMLLNLIAHEMCSAHDGPEAWVTSYVCLLDSLIDHPEDVKALRRAGVLDNSLGSDNDVAKLFNEIGTDLVPNITAYSDAKNNIQKHYDSLRNTRLSQLKHEYIKSPWSFLALVGAVIALVLSFVQTYVSVWSPKGDCDDLCMFLKMNHHL